LSKVLFQGIQHSNFIILLYLIENLLNLSINQTKIESKNNVGV